MAIKGFKEIVDKKGYKVNAKDRSIFEREVGKSYFGLGISDMIEFIVYDSNDNQLPQGEKGELVRYIPLDNENIRKYFLLTQNPSNMKMNGADEYIVDVEKLITEAGYSNGIFKTQVSLLNRRVGSESVGKDKLWIHEISPSRTEIRILPIEDENEEVYEDLQKRLDIILNGGNFRDDTIYFVKSMVESIKVEEVLKSFLTINGNVASGESYVQLIKKEFKIQDWELFINQVRDELIKGAQYYVENKDWNINSNNYGKPTSQSIDLELSVNKIKEVLGSILINVINFYLPKRSIQEENILTHDEQITLDAAKQILKTVTSGTTYQTDSLVNKQGVVRGCTDPNAKNYNPLAQEDDGSCVYPAAQGGDDIISEPEPVGTLITKTWYGWKDGSSTKYKNEFGIQMQKFKDGEKFTLLYYDGSFKVAEGGDVRDYPKPVISPPDTNDLLSPGGLPIISLSDKPRYTPPNVPRVDIPTEVVVGGQTFEVTPLPLDMVGGSRVSGEGSQGNPTIGGSDRLIPTPGQIEVVVGTKKNIAEK